MPSGSSAASEAQEHCIVTTPFSPLLPTDPHAVEQAIALSRAWVEHAVIGLNLCPFAKPVHVKGQIAYRVSAATTEDALADDLLQAMQWLLETSPDETDTCLLIHPWALQDFMAYNDFLDIAESLLADAGLDGVLQIASFHPDYQFAGTQADDITNSSNRSPFPMLHLLREASLDKATAAMPDASDIVDRNLATLRALGPEGWEALQLRIRTAAKTPG